jgi:hypothetical protein
MRCKAAILEQRKEEIQYERRFIDKLETSTCH